MEVSKKLHQNIEEAIQSYVDIFCQKHELQFEGWVAEKSGTIGLFNDYYFSFEDIRLDLELSIPKDKIFEWYNQQLEAKESERVNYYSYTLQFSKKKTSLNNG